MPRGKNVSKKTAAKKSPPPPAKHRAPKIRLIEPVENAGVLSEKAARWCDMNCVFAGFAKKSALDGSGTCRTFQAIYCKKLKKHVTKNAPCEIAHGARRPSTGW